MAQSEYKITVLGGGGVGKSALTIRLVTDNFLDEYDPTIEDSYRKQVEVDSKSALLDILDTAGQEEFSSMQDLWMREGKGFLLVYSITSLHTLEECEVLRDKILRTKEEDASTPIVLCGNKCDLNDQREVETGKGQAIAKKWNVPFFETSAKMKINNVACFYEIVRQIRKTGDVKPQNEQKKSKFQCNLL